MRYVLQVTSRAVEGRDDEFNQWYDNVHVREVLALPGFNACTRYVRDVEGQAPLYVAQYEVETDDPGALMQTLAAAGPTFQLTDALDQTSANFEFMRAHGERFVAAD